MCRGASSCRGGHCGRAQGRASWAPEASQLLSERFGVTAGQGGLRRVDRRVGAGWAEPHAFPPVSTNSSSSDPRGRGLSSQASPAPDFSSVFLLSARRGHLRGGPAGGGAPASAVPHSQGGPGTARQQVSVVKGPGKRPRARPAALVPLQAGRLSGNF